MLHELGVLHYHNGEYHEAARYFLQVAEKDATQDPQTCRPATLLCCLQPYFAACN